MRYIWTLAAKDLLQTRRDRMAALFTFILPTAFTVFFGLLMGGLSSGSERIPLAVADGDGGVAARKLVSLLESSPLVELKMIDAAAVDKAVDDEQVAAGLLIPAGFSASLDSDVGARLTVVRVLGSTGSQSVEEAVRAAADRLASERLAAAVAVRTVEDSPRAAQVGEIVSGLLERPALTIAAKESGSKAGQIPRGFDQSSPGMLVNWVMFSLLTVATGLVMERKTGALRRLLGTHASRSQVIAGKALAMLILTMLQQVLLIGLGQFAFGVDYLSDPPALLMTMVTLSALASCLGLLIATVFRSEQAVIATTVIASMVLSALGGAWFPLEVTGPGFSRIAHLVPTSWLLDALRGIVLKGWGVPEVLLPLGVVWAFSLAFFALAVWRFRFE